MIDCEAGSVSASITDDGAGFDPTAARARGLGLVGMQERVHAYGGAVQAGPRPAGGWRVTARLHLDGGDAP